MAGDLSRVDSAGCGVLSVSVECDNITALIVRSFLVVLVFYSTVSVVRSFLSSWWCMIYTFLGQWSLSRISQQSIESRGTTPLLLLPGDSSGHFGRQDVLVGEFENSKGEPTIVFGLVGFVFCQMDGKSIIIRVIIIR